MTRYHLFCFFFAIAALAPASALAAPEACACKHLESVQQELENAEYEAKYFMELSKRLDAVEKQQADLNKNHPTHRDSGRSVHQTSADARDAIKSKEFVLPHPRVKRYKGPNTVEVGVGTCENKDDDLTKLAEGSSCKELGDISLAHEAQHRALCNQMGKDPYWARLPSLIAAEEAERYAEQAKEMRQLLKKVVDGGKFRVSAEMEVTTSGRGLSTTYFYSTMPFDFSGKSNPGADRWILRGEGKRAGVIKRAALPGMQCSPYGQMNDKLTGSLTLDGLSMGLILQSQTQPGDIGIRCKVGNQQAVAMSLRPQGEMGASEVLKSGRVRFMTEVVEDVAQMEFAKVLASGGMSASGYSKMRVELVCRAK